jgi:hypothetical protein
VNPATQNIVVTVNPAPNLTVTNNSPSICEGDVTDIILNSTTPGAMVELIDVTLSDPSVSGASPIGTMYNVLPATIADPLLNPTNSPQTVVYEFEVTAFGFTFPSTQVAVVTINPTPTFTVTNNTPTINSGEATDIDINSPTSGAVVTLTAVTPSDPGITGFTTPGATFLDGNKLIDNLTSVTNMIETVTYTFQVSANGCTNPATQNVVVSINPAPDMTVTNNSPVICDGEPTDIEVTSTTVNAVIEIISITLSDPGITGFSPVGTTYNSFPSNVTDVLNNPTNTPQTITYEFEVTASGFTFPASQTTVVTINPTPIFTATNNVATLCPGM